MRTTLRFAAILACSVLVACSSEDSGVAPVDDTGTADTSVDSTPGDTGSADTGSGEDSSMTDTGSADSGSADSGSADSGSADGSSDSTSSETSTDGGSETATDAGKACSFSGGGCDATEYCDAPTCDMGTCKPRPATATKDYAPACGCDGVTYWNQSVAAVTGHGSYAGKCAADGSGVGITKFCGIKGCADDEVCIQDLTDHGSCGLGGFGKTCWRLVSGGTCPAGSADTPKVRTCMGGTPDTCTGYCRGVLAQDSGDITGFLEDSTCP